MSVLGGHRKKLLNMPVETRRDGRDKTAGRQPEANCSSFFLVCVRVCDWKDSQLLAHTNSEGSDLTSSARRVAGRD